MGNSKRIFYLIFILIIIIGGSFGFFIGKTGTADRLTGGLLILDWFLLFCALMVGMCILLFIFSSFINKRKAGDTFFTIRKTIGKLQKRIFFFSVLICVLEYYLFLYNPSLYSALAFVLLAVIPVFYIIQYARKDAICENGVYISGSLITWNRIKNFIFLSGNTLSINIIHRSNNALVENHFRYTPGEKDRIEKFLKAKLKR